MGIEQQLIPAFEGLGVVNALGTVGGGAVTIPAPAVAKVTTVTISANTTFTLPSAAGLAGVDMDVEITQDGTGSRTGTFTGVKFPGGNHTLSTAPAAIDKVSFRSDGTNWIGSLALALA